MPNQLSFNDFILCAALARRIHGSDQAIRETCYRCRDKVRLEHRPLLSKLMRHPKIGTWLDMVMEEL